MRFALTKEIISPKEAIHLAGFANRTEKSTGIHDDIYAKAVLLEANQPLLILAFDAIGCDRSFTYGIKQALDETFGLKAEQILLNFSHAHSTIHLTGDDPNFDRDKHSLDGGGIYYANPENKKIDFSRDFAYYRELKKTIIEMVERCFHDLEEGMIEMGQGLTGVSICRRKMTDEGIVWLPNPDAEIDKTVTVFRLLSSEGMMKGIVFSHGCHPSSMNNLELSAEFVGHACRCIEAHYPGVEAVFLQGCAAEIKPLKSADEKLERFKLCSFEDMMEIGRDFADDVIQVIEQAKFRTIKPAFKAKLVDVTLFPRKTTAEDYIAKLHDPNEPELMKNVYRELLKTIQAGKGKDRLPLFISLWHLDEDTRMIAMEGEISTEYSLKLKQLFGEEQTLVLGYSNGCPTYIPTRKMIRESGYEAERAPMLFGYIGPFEEEIEDIIIGKIVKEEMLTP